MTGSGKHFPESQFVLVSFVWHSFLAAKFLLFFSYPALDSKFNSKASENWAILWFCNNCPFETRSNLSATFYLNLRGKTNRSGNKLRDPKTPLPGLLSSRSKSSRPPEQQNASLYTCTPDCDKERSYGTHLQRKLCFRTIFVLILILDLKGKTCVAFKTFENC